MWRLLRVWGVWISFKGYAVLEEPKQDLQLQSWFKQSLFSVWVTPWLSLVADRVPGVHRQDLKVQLWSGGCLVWELQGLFSANADDGVLLESSS